MGCWNNTCGLTNLPINAGDEVYVFPIQERDLSGYRSHCYSTALYRPSIIPFVAEYNDYGGGEKCSGIALDPTIEGLRLRLVELEVGENKYHDIAVKRNDFDVDKFFESVHENRLYIKGHGKTNRPVFFTMVRKDIVDRMWNEWTFDMWKAPSTKIPEGFDTDHYYVKNVTYAKLAGLLPAYISNLVKMQSESKSTGYFIFGKDSILEGIFRAFEDYNFWDLLDGREIITSFIEAGKLDAAEEFIRALMVGVMINNMMETTRRVWLPVMHLGSQSECYDEYKFLHQLANDVIDAKEAEYER